MNLIHTTKPDSRQKTDMEDLIASCKSKEPMSLSAPLDDDIDYDILLLYQDSDSSNPVLKAMAFLFFPEECLCECCVFVEPDSRRQGHFSRLLDKCLDLVEAYEKKLGRQVDFCFLVDEKTPSAMAVMEAIQAEYWYSEYKMERELTKKDSSLSMASLAIKDEGDNLYSALLEDKVIGTCAILPSGSEFYLYAFQIQEAYQGQGYGREFLRGILALLSAKGGKVSLQVSGSNYIARNLYKKTGFRTTESLSFYLY